MGAPAGNTAHLKHTQKHPRSARLGLTDLVQKEHTKGRTI